MISSLDLEKATKNMMRENVKEVEITCALSPESQRLLHEKLSAMTRLATTQQLDTYYDTANWDLLRQAVFVRVRNSTTLQVKFDEEGSDKQHIECVERAFSVLVPLPETAHELLRRFLPQWVAVPTFEEAVAANHLNVLVRLKKTRTLYSDGELIVALDHVEGLGDFVEVEIVCEEGEETSRARATLTTFAHEIAAVPLQAGYTELWLEKHNPDAYRAGQYHL
jgi:adenylate cyclase class 2